MRLLSVLSLPGVVQGWCGTPLALARWEQLVLHATAEDRHPSYFGHRWVLRDREWWVDDDPSYDPFRLCWCPRFGALLVWAVDSDAWLLPKGCHNIPQHASQLIRLMDAWGERMGLPRCVARTRPIQEALYALHHDRDPCVRLALRLNVCRYVRASYSE